MKAELIIEAPIMDQKMIWVKKIHKPHFDHPFHYHQLCELVWLEKSYGKLIIGDYVGNFAEGELVMKSAELPHLWRCDAVFYKKKKELCTKATALFFPPALIPNITDNPESISLYRDLLHKSTRGLRFYGKTRERVIELIKKIQDRKGLEQMGIFLQIIDIVSKSREFEYLASVGYKNLHNEQDITRFNDVYQFVLKNFHDDITLNEVAQICNMSPNSFCRFFKNKTQKTFIRFLNEIRIGHACKLLQNDNYSVQEICYECGYNNPVNFFKFFKLIIGKTPKEYRRHLHQVEELV
jgi:AraC-like DNA-binding protein